MCHVIFRRNMSYIPAHGTKTVFWPTLSATPGDVAVLRVPGCAAGDRRRSAARSHRLHKRADIRRRGPHDATYRRRRIQHRHRKRHGRLDDSPPDGALVAHRRHAQEYSVVSIHPRNLPLLCVCNNVQRRRRCGV